LETDRLNNIDYFAEASYFSQLLINHFFFSNIPGILLFN